ncbi:tetratricopeptide repeat protein [Chlorobaculum sp. 24CR]|uniref:tetratricopeptide repeat protein n=1 Tax=Chlorobaculum sp. 24CR TaxID=2508878 RepID=UPI00100AADC4|nr:tetratricopeptide repeat protein [Chlorobaculum sp. 24CR]RXK89118.1 tetratricopeptide repeat protein [Chlorobaculum sp. 24CR]
MDRPCRIAVFRRLVALLALLVGAALSASPAKAASSRESTATSSTSTAAASDGLPEYAQGLFLDMKGDYWEAIDLFRKVIAKTPGNAAVNYSISKSWLRLAVLDSARVYGEAAVKLDPSNRYYLRYLAGVAHDMRDYDRAAALYGQESVLEPDRTDILYLQGLEYLAAKRPEQALQVFEKAARIDPYNEAALIQTLTLEIGLKRYPEAIETSRQLLGLGGNERKVGITLAGLYVKTGQEALAVRTLRELIESDRDNIAFRIALFDHYIEGGRTVEYHRAVIDFFDKASMPPEKLYDFAKLYILRSGKDSLYVEPTRILLNELIVRRPHDSELIMLTGMYGAMHGRQQEGAVLFRKAVQLDPGNATAWEYLITTQFDLGQKREAFELLANVRRMFPRQRQRWRVIEGSLLLSSRELRRAVVVLESVVAAKPQPDQNLLIQANTNLAMACDLLGMKKRSRAAYERVLELDPHNTLAMNNLAYLFAEEGIRLRQALRLATNAVMLEPDSGVFLDTLGWVHFKLGNHELARQTLEKAVATGIDETEVYRHLAEAYRKLGNEAKARQMLEKAKNVKKR